MQNPFLAPLSTAVFGTQTGTPTVTGTGHLPSVYKTSDFANATLAMAGIALAHLSEADPSYVVIDRRLASLWFDMTLRPIGWEQPSLWDAVAGDYACADGWIRLHTNAPHHRDAALCVLGTPPDRTAVADAVAAWSGSELETAVVSSGGCAAHMRSAKDWAAHPQGQAIARAPLVEWTDHNDCAPKPLAPSAPLAGIKVLDLTRVLAGPVASRFLAGYGADVLRIDPPFWNEPSVVPEVTLGKRCAGLDLRKSGDRNTLRTLMAQADVFLHGYRADALENLGFGAQARRAINPSLIDVSLNAYGWTGPWVNRRGFDSLVQMSCGIAAEGQAQTGNDRPKPLPVQALDHGTGYLLAASVLRALAERAAGRVMSARLSLAASAHMLMQHPCSYDTDGAITLQDSDISDVVEETSWGKARRVSPPITVCGAAPQWRIGAGNLRRHPATWA